MRGEAPITSHLLLTQPGILDDGDPLERVMGISAGLAWLPVADASVIYIDLGYSSGMLHGEAAAHAAGVKIEYRFVSGWRGPWTQRWGRSNVLKPPRPARAPTSR